MGQVGSWLEINREAVYDTTEALCDTTVFGLMTCKPGAVYLHVLYRPGTELVLADLKNPVESAQLLASGQTLTLAQTGNHVRITGLPPTPPDPRNTVAKLEVDGVPQAHLMRVIESFLMEYSHHRRQSSYLLARHLVSSMLALRHSSLSKVELNVWV